ncbi:hypothetical protein [Parageobacillus thermoglucosidasius]|uniref:hypothetical protein n=1 Tax=Parageobacillus thermoglucosidasius TaxID=1426 RepID=UPI000AB24A53|nr:hypothetical protein [Parageobacillus thermoglucosidasius]
MMAYRKEKHVKRFSMYQESIGVFKENAIKICEWQIKFFLDRKNDMNDDNNK